MVLAEETTEFGLVGTPSTIRSDCGSNMVLAEETTEFGLVGTPSTIRSDCGSNFTSSLTTTFTKNLAKSIINY